MDHRREWEHANNAITKNIDSKTASKEIDLRFKDPKRSLNKNIDAKKEGNIHERLDELYKEGKYSSQEAQLLREKLSDLSKIKDFYTKAAKEVKCQTEKDLLKP